MRTQGEFGLFSKRIERWLAISLRQDGHSGRDRGAPGRQQGLATLEIACMIIAGGSLLIPAVGLIDLVLTRAALQSITHDLTINNTIAPFRMFSGQQSWFTRPIDGADERNPNSQSDPRVLLETQQYHLQLDAIANVAEQAAKDALGQHCRVRDCSHLYRVELRVLIPYIEHDTGELIRLVCFRRAVQGSGDSCPAGLASDLEEVAAPGAGPHRFVRVRGSLLRGSDAFLVEFVERISGKGKERSERRGVPFRYAATPSGLFGVQHAQLYGMQDLTSQHGYHTPSNYRIHPSYLRHVAFLGLRIYVDIRHSPAGLLLRSIRKVKRGSTIRDAETIFADAISVPRQEF